MEKQELLQLVYIRVAKAAQLLQMAGEEPLAEEAEALAEKVTVPRPPKPHTPHP